MSSCERSENTDLSQSPHHHNHPNDGSSTSPHDGNNVAANGGEMEDGSSSSLRNFTMEQLAFFNGQMDDTSGIPKSKEPEAKAIYVSLKGMVFDVSEGRRFYGPGGPYEVLAGRECGMALAKMNIDDPTLLDDVDSTSSLNEEESAKLNKWIHKFQTVKKYPLLGRLVPPSKLPNPQRSLSRNELEAGSANVVVPEGYAVAPIYLGVDGIVFDVSFGGLDFYGPGCPYHKFAGKDASRALAKLSLDDKDISNCHIHDLTEKEIKTMKDWKSSFETKRQYPIVGRLPPLPSS